MKRCKPHKRGGDIAREVRQKLAKERGEEAAKRTLEEQLEILDRRLGKGQGAKKERAKIAARIEERDKKPEIVLDESTLSEVEETPEPKEKMKAKDRRKNGRKTRRGNRGGK